MLRILIVGVICAAVGVGLGWVQASIVTSRIEERFLGSRHTIAEARGELTREEILEQAQGKPKLVVVGGPEHDFGTMMHGQQMSHVFLVKNEGDGPLILEMGPSTCKCTVGDLDKSILQPGEETEVKLTWKAQSLTREFGQSATLLTNDTEQLEVHLDVVGEIVKSFVMEPSAIELGSFSDTETINTEFYVFSYLEGAETLSDLEWTDLKTRAQVKLETKRVDLDADQFPNYQQALVAHEVKLTIEPGLPIGPLSSRIQFRTDQGDNVGTLSVAVTGKVAGQLELHGGPSFDPRLNMVDMGKVKSSEGAAVSIYLFVQGNDRDQIVPEVLSVRPEEALRVEIGKPRESQSRTVYPIRFEVPKGAPEVYYPAQSTTSHGRVVIGTRGARTQELPINIRLVVEN